MKLHVLALSLIAALVGAAPASAAGPRAGAWYGASPQGAVLFDVSSRGVIGPVSYWSFGRRCPGIDTVGTFGRSVSVRPARNGRFTSPRTGGAKVVVSGRASAGAIRLTARPVFGRPAELRCFTRSFVARPAGDAPLAAGGWTGTVAEQPPTDEYAKPKPAQAFRFTAASGGRVFQGGGEGFRVGLRCEGTYGTEYEADLFDLARPVSPEGVVGIDENTTGDTRIAWSLRATSKTAAEGSLRVRMRNSDGVQCDSGEIALSATRS